MKRPSKGWCEPCLYYGKSTDTCDYILMEDRRRPCPAGYGCIARRLRKDVRKSMNPKWDTSIGKEMFLGGRSDREIADFFGIAVSTVSYQRRKNWEADNTPPPAAESVETVPVVVEPAAPAPALTEPPAAPGWMPDVYMILEEATGNLQGINAICTAEAIRSLWRWESIRDLQKARAAIDYLLRKMEENND